MSGKNFGKNVWKKIQGVKNFGNEGEGRFREILSCPPKMRVAPQMPPQIPRPGAATGQVPLVPFPIVKDPMFLISLSKWL